MRRFGRLILGVVLVGVGAWLIILIGNDLTMLSGLMAAGCTLGLTGPGLILLSWDWLKDGIFTCEDEPGLFKDCPPRGRK